MKARSGRRQGWRAHGRARDHGPQSAGRIQGPVGRTGPRVRTRRRQAVRIARRPTTRREGERAASPGAPARSRSGRTTPGRRGRRHARRPGSLSRSRPARTSAAPQPQPLKSRRDAMGPRSAPLRSCSGAPKSVKSDVSGRGVAVERAEREHVAVAGHQVVDQRGEVLVGERLGVEPENLRQIPVPGLTQRRIVDHARGAVVRFRPRLPRPCRGRGRRGGPRRRGPGGRRRCRRTG